MDKSENGNDVMKGRWTHEMTPGSFRFLGENEAGGHRQGQGQGQDTLSCDLPDGEPGVDEHPFKKGAVNHQMKSWEPSADGSGHWSRGANRRVTNEGHQENEEGGGRDTYRRRNGGQKFRGSNDANVSEEIEMGNLPPVAPEAPEASGGDTKGKGKGKGKGKKSLPANEGLPEMEEELFEHESMVSKRITIAGGFLDFALFTSNVEQLKFLLETEDLRSTYHKLLLGLIVTSLLMQIVTGGLLLVSGFMDTSGLTKKQAFRSGLIHHITMGFVALIALVNVFITIFGNRSDLVLKLRSLKCPSVRESLY